MYSLDLYDSVLHDWLFPQHYHCFHKKYWNNEICCAVSKENLELYYWRCPSLIFRIYGSGLALHIISMCEQQEETCYEYT